MPGSARELALPSGDTKRVSDRFEARCDFSLQSQRLASAEGIPRRFYRYN
jgi:hypothetical protein